MAALPVPRRLEEDLTGDFYLRPGAVHINHGAYGAVPRPVREYKLRLQEEMEGHPDDWFRRKMPAKLLGTRQAVAAFLNTRLDDTFLVQNASTACNTVLKSFPLTSGDAILVSSLTYGSVRKAVEYVISRTTGAELVDILVRFPIKSESELLEQYREAFREHPNIKFVVIDHITSPTAILLPVKRLAEICHQHGAVVLVDGAHAPGQLPLSLPDLDVDFYTGNFHKWGFAPRSCAVLWKNPKTPHDWLSPLVTTVTDYHGDGLSAQFAYEGTSDNTSFLAIVEAIRYMDSLGGVDKIVAHSRQLKTQAVTYLVTCWETGTLPVPVSMEAPCMQLVRLPDLSGYQKTTADAARLFNDLFTQYDVQSYVKYIQGELYIRVSAQVYNTMQDFHKLSNVIRALMKQT